MNYFEIGQRIRKYRKSNNLSQEELAEKVGISVTHMSHIETGNTKLSLPVLVEIAKELGIYTDEIIYSAPIDNKSKKLNDISLSLEQCTTQQLAVISDIVKATITAMNKHL